MSDISPKQTKIDLFIHIFICLKKAAVDKFDKFLWNCGLFADEDNRRLLCLFSILDHMQISIATMIQQHLAKERKQLTALETALK